MAGEVFKLSILLESKDNASKGVMSLVSSLQKLQAEGKKTVSVYTSLQNAVNKGFKIGNSSSVKNLKKDLSDISKQFDKITKQGKGVFSDSPRRPKTRDRFSDETPRHPKYKDAKDELDNLTNPAGSRRGGVQRLANLNEKVFQPAGQIKDTWKDQFDSLRQYTDEAKKLYVAEAKFKLINLSPEENTKAFDAITKSVRKMGLTTQTEGTETLTDLHTALGSLPHAIEALETASKYRFSMQTLFGDKFSDSEIEEQIQNAYKFLEVTGKVAKGSEEMNKGFNALTQMSTATGGRVMPSELLLMGRRAGASARNLSPEGLRNLSAPVQELGGSGTGVALMSMFQGLVGGTMKQRSIKQFQKLGLIDESKVEYGKGGKIDLLPGANKLGDLMMTDPLSAADMLHQAMITHGVKDDPKEISDMLTHLFQNRNAQNLMDILINQRPQVVKESNLAKNSKDNEGLFGVASEGKLGDIKKFEVAFTDLKIQAGIPLIETFGKLAQSGLPIAKFFGEHQTITQWAMAAILEVENRGYGHRLYKYIDVQTQRDIDSGRVSMNDAIERARPGLPMTDKVKRTAIMLFEKAWREGVFKACSQNLCDEATVFVQDGNKMGAKSGYHDDEIMTCAIGQFVIETDYIGKISFASRGQKQSSAKMKGF